MLSAAVDVEDRERVVVVAEVERVSLGEQSPLLYVRGAYARLAT